MASSQTVYLKDYRPPPFWIKSTELKFQLGEEGTLVSSRLAIERNTAADSADDLILDAEQMTVLSVSLDGADLPPVRWQHKNQKLLIQGVGDAFVIECQSLIHPESNTSLNGLYRSRGMFCSQCEPHGFRTITPYIDRPDVLSVFSVRIEGDAAAYPVLLSNGNLVEKGALPEGKHYAQWHDPFPKPAYLFALVAGNLDRVEDRFTTMSGRDVDLHIYVESKDLNKVSHAMESLKQAMFWDEQKYGREYDLDLFMIVAVDDFNMGAMENKGLNIFNTSAVLADPQITTDARYLWIQAVVAHEYFHNWSGNRVTCRDWFQLSLKEGFTVFRDGQFSADLNSSEVKRIESVSGLKAHQFAEDAGPLAHPVQPPSYQEINNFYTSTVYEKGAEIVSMQANLLGPESFRRGTDLYFERFDGQAVTIEDFVGCMAEVSGLDMTQFMNWYRQAGTPVVDAKDSYDASTKTYRLKLRQSCPATPESKHKQPFVIPVRLGLVGADGDIAFVAEGGGVPVQETLLTLDQVEQEFVFTSIAEHPTPSLLRDLSAPVKLHYPWQDEQLARIARRDSNGFNRWEAAQQLASRAIDKLANGSSVSAAEPLLSLYSELLAQFRDNPALTAKMLPLPSLDALAEQYSQINLDSLYKARNTLRQHLSAALEGEFEQLFLANQTDVPYAANAEQIAQRALKNSALGWWMATASPAAIRASVEQFSGASNMTDRTAALIALVNCPGAQAHAQSSLATFYRDWKHEPLAVNQWLSVQASCDLPGGLQRVQELLHHEAFDIRNPNKVRSVVGSFCTLNPDNFHNTDGSGYRFLADKVLELDRLNPQTASRMVNPLSRWRRFSTPRAELMRTELMRLSAVDLSPDLREIVDKSLA